MKGIGPWSGLLLFLLAFSGLSMAPLAAQERGTELEDLRTMMRHLQEQNARQQKQIDELQRRLDARQETATTTRREDTSAAAPANAAAAADALDAALAEIDAAPASAPAAASGADVYTRRVGGAELRLIDISFDVLAAAGWSSERGDALRNLQGGGHDPNRRGFTLQQGEFSLQGAVDPYFTAESHLIFGTDFVELEEAFFTTTALPFDLQLEGGQFLTEFGRLNPTHPHAWDWVDQPVINTRMFGGDGLRAPGVSLSWLVPLPWYSDLIVGLQNAGEGDLTYSFLNGGEGVGGRPGTDTEVKNLGDLLYHTRLVNSWELGDEITALLGFSGLFGPNASGDDGRTFLYGGDLTMKWRSRNNFRGWPFLTWQSEIMKRDFTADRFVSGGEPQEHDSPAHGGTAAASDEPVAVDLPGAILRDWGGYSQLLWGFTYPWAAGVRLEYASGHGKSFLDGALTSRRYDPLRGDRFRFAPLLVYYPTHFSRLRLQYNLDDAKFLGGSDLAHSVWLSAEVLYGAHPAHKF
jgi:hypothetical protein